MFGIETFNTSTVSQTTVWFFLSTYWPNKTSAICFSDICQSSEKDIEIAYVEYIVDKRFFVFQIIGIPI